MSHGGVGGHSSGGGHGHQGQGGHHGTHHSSYTHHNSYNDASLGHQGQGMHGHHGGFGNAISGVAHSLGGVYHQIASTLTHAIAQFFGLGGHTGAHHVMPGAHHVNDFPSVARAMKETAQNPSAMPKRSIAPLLIPIALVGGLGLWLVVLQTLHHNELKEKPSYVNARLGSAVTPAMSGNSMAPVVNQSMAASNQMTPIPNQLATNQPVANPLAANQMDLNGLSQPVKPVYDYRQKQDLLNNGLGNIDENYSQAFGQASSDGGNNFGQAVSGETNKAVAESNEIPAAVTNQSAVTNTNQSPTNNPYVNQKLRFEQPLAGDQLSNQGGFPIANTYGSHPGHLSPRVTIVQK